MCRMFGYVHAGSAVSMRESLGDSVLDEFVELAEVHRDGWGIVETGTDSLSCYVSTQPASCDSVFRALTLKSIGSAILHERLASPGILRVLDNQQPFASDGVAFAHNGTIADKGDNIVHRPGSYRESLGLAHSTTMSDSRIYADLFFAKLIETREKGQTGGRRPTAEEVRQALAATLALLRRDYPEASFNAMIETADFTFAARAHANSPVCSEGLRRVYESAGWSHRIDEYYKLLYKIFAHPDGSATSVVSSSGYAASDEWDELANNTLLAMSHADATVRLMSLEA